MKPKQQIRRFLPPLALLMVLLALLVASQSAIFAQQGPALAAPLLTATPAPPVAQDRWAGVVSDENGAPLTATVTINGVNGVASADGTFELYVPRASDQRYVINVEKFGYVPVSQIHIGNAVGALNLTLKQAQRFDIDPSQAVDVEDERGTQISLPANSLVDANGNPASGPLQLQVYTYDLASEEMPGDMSASDSNGEPVALESAGVFFAEFSDASGNEYNLAPNTQAEISIPVDQSAEWPDNIPLWSYDESQGLWIEEGQASQVNGRFSGSVSHFSFWNFDVKWTAPACIKLTVDPVFLALNSPIQVKAVLKSPNRVRNLSLVQTPNVLINLPPNAKVNFYMPPSSPTAFASVDTGAAWGGTGVPPHPYDDCNGTLHINDHYITEVTPRYGLNDGPSTIYIYGNGFSDSSTVKLGSQALDVNFVMLDEEPQRIRAVVPADVTPGTYDITVETGSDSATLPDAYEVLDAGITDDLLSEPEWLWTNPMPMRVGYSDSSVGLLVQHLGGTATLDSVTVEFRLGGPDGDVLGRALTNLLAPDATESTGPVTWEPTEPSHSDDDPVDYTVCAIIDPDNAVPETNEDNNIICRGHGRGVDSPITVLPPHFDPEECPDPNNPECDTEPPEVDSFMIDNNAASTNQQAVRLDVDATDYPLDDASGMNAVRRLEFEYIHGARRWVPVKVSDWEDYETSQSNYDWELIPSYGMRYMQAWASDNNQNISLKPGVDVIDLLPTEQTDTVGRNGVVIYRILLEEGEHFAATMTPQSGDPDMYVWLQDGSLQHNINPGAETVEFDAPLKGTYQIEIHGPSSGSADYRLTFGASRGALMDDPTAHSHRAPEDLPGRNKDGPAVPLDEWPEYYDVGIPPVAPEYTIYLPIIILESHPSFPPFPPIRPSFPQFP